MTKEEAREKLNEHIAFHFEQFGGYKFPIVDETASFKMTSETIENIEKDKIYIAPFKFEQWSFKGLIKIAYGLCDEKQTDV